MSTFRLVTARAKAGASGAAFRLTRARAAAGGGAAFRLIQVRGATSVQSGAVVVAAKTAADPGEYVAFDTTGSNGDYIQLRQIAGSTATILGAHPDWLVQMPTPAATETATFQVIAMNDFAPDQTASVDVTVWAVNNYRWNGTAWLPRVRYEWASIVLPPPAEPPPITPPGPPSWSTTLTAENGTAGATLTVDNVPASAVTIGGTSAATFATDRAYSGSRSYKFVASATTDTSFVRVPLDRTTEKQGFVDGVVWIDSAYPSATVRIASLRSGLGLAGSIGILSTGQLRIYDGLGTAVVTSTGLVPLNAWVRVTLELTVATTSTGIASATFRQAGSDTPTETISTTTGNFGTSLLESSDFGKISNQATTAPFTMWADEWKVGAGPLPAVGASGRTVFTPTGIAADGVTNDYPAILAALIAASNAGGGIVQLGAGVHVINRWLPMKPGVTLAGMGPGVTVIKAGPTFLSTIGNYGGYPGISTNNQDNVTIRDLTMDMSGDTLNGNVSGRLNEYSIDLRFSSNVLVSNVAVRNPYSYSIVAANADHFRISGCDVAITSSGRYNQLDQLHILNSHDGIVDHNTVNGGVDGDDGLVAHTLSGGSVHHVRYMNNDVVCGSNGHLMQFALSTNTETIHHIVIAGNKFHNSPRGIMRGLYGGATTATVDSVSIDNNDFSDNAYAVTMGTSTDTNITNVTVTNNRAHNTGAFSVPTGGGNSVSGTVLY